MGTAAAACQTYLEMPGQLMLHCVVSLLLSSSLLFVTMMVTMTIGIFSRSFGCAPALA